MKLSSELIDKKLIGKIIFEGLPTKYRFNKIKKLLLNGNFEKIPISGHPLSLIDLPNGNLVCGTTNAVILFSENLQSIKEVSTGGRSFCASNLRNEICVSVEEKHCILVFDSNLNQLKEFGSEGERNNQLNGPQRLCCHDDYFYIVILEIKEFRY